MDMNDWASKMDSEFLSITNFAIDFTISISFVQAECR